ncbi:MAG: hypothetical protein DWQ07_09515 [Chloroflexi bacterium]|nr:MAG: hypothetical protein DWQ07_09515 [Chloroflexota bacterium]MBL1193049.1 hypothetical protein [Chloroflexota bacterium]NOH10342.1 hypothetical protein [Chloroflexota bacterium]
MKKKFVIGLLVIFSLAACSSPAPPSTAQTELLVDTVTPTPAPFTTTTPLPTLTPTITSTPSPTPSYFVRDGTPVPQPAEPISVDNVSQIAELARWGYGTVQRVLFMADDEIMIVKTPIAVYAYTMGTVDELWRLELPKGFSAVASSTDKQELAVGTYDGVILRLDARTGKEIVSWKAHEEEIISLDYASDDTMLASSGEDWRGRVWAVNSLESITEFGYDEGVSNLFFVAEDSQLAMRVHDPGQGIAYVFLDLAKNIILSDRIDDDFIQVVSPEQDAFVYHGPEGFSVRDFLGNMVSEFDPPEQMYYGWGPLDYTFSPDGSLLAVGSDFGSISVFDVYEGTLVASFGNPPESNLPSNGFAKPFRRSGASPAGIRSVDISDDNRLLVASNGYGDLFLWDLETLQRIRSVADFGRGVFFLPNSQRIMSTFGSFIDIYSISNLQRVAFVPGGRGSKLAFSPGGSRLAYGRLVWEVENGEVQHVPKDEWFLSFSPNGNYFYTISPEWWVHQRRTADMQLQQQRAIIQPQLEDNEWWVSSIPAQWYEMGGWVISPDNTLIHASSYEMPVFSWSVEDGEYVGATGGSPASVVVYSPDNKYFVNHGSATEHFGIYTVEGGLPVYKFSIPFEDGFAYEVSISQDSKLLLIGAMEKAYAFDLESGNKLFSEELSDQNYPVRAVATTPDNKALAASINHMIYFYDFFTGTLIGTVENNFSGHSVEHLTFSHDGRYLATASSDGTVRLWGIPPN